MFRKVDSLVIGTMYYIEKKVKAIYKGPLYIGKHIFFEFDILDATNWKYRGPYYTKRHSYYVVDAQ
jgi:hypothetical protein